MKDIDFDELDRAVSSVMGPSTIPQTQPVTQEVTVGVATPSAPVEPVDLAPDPVPNAEPLNTSSVEPNTADSQSIEAPLEPISQDQSTVDTPSSPAVKRSGRFMDVMHPSSDMRTETMGPAPSREGVAVAPVAEQVTVDDTPEIELSEPQPVEPVTYNPPMSSPFLADAQVDKRPLGGNETSLGDINAMLSQELSGDKAELNTETDSTQDVSEPEEIDQSSQIGGVTLEDQLPPSSASAPMPAELSSDLVAIEAAEASTTAPIDIEETTLPPAPETAPATEQPVEQSNPVAGSIPQQYAEQPSTGDQTHTPIYDTEAQAQPLAHPAKKKSGWLVLLWIFLLAILGSAAGIALYMFKII